MATQPIGAKRPNDPRGAQEPDGPWSYYRPAHRWLLLAILFLAILCSMTDRYLMAVLLEPIKKEFGASDTVMGGLTGFAFAALYAVLGLPVARWADRGDRRLIIALAVGTWSVMSALCGLVKSLPMLAAARVGVGIGEAGSVPPSMSLVADYFPPSQRGRAASVLVLATSMGIVVAYIAGAQIAAAHGWRTAFLWLSLPGIPLAILAYLFLDEPRRRVATKLQGTSPETIGDSISAVLRKRSLVFVILGFSFYAMVTAGAHLWIPAYLVRVLKVDLASSQMAIYGSIATLIPLVGTSVGGVITDKLAKRSLAWYGWLPALGVLIALPFYIGMFLTRDFRVFLFCSMLAPLALAMTIPAVTVLMLTVSGARRRSFVFAIYGFFANFIGAGLGPLLTGALSDSLTPTYGADGLRYAMIVAHAALVLPVLFFFLAARHVPKDAES